MNAVVMQVAVKDLVISPLNVRKHPGDLSELKASMKSLGGMIELPRVRARGDTYEVISGSRRVLAAQELGLETILVLVEELTDSQALLSSLIENLVRDDLSLEDRVQAYKKLQTLDPDTYGSYHALARATGRSHQKIVQDFQAYEMLIKLRPYGITVASDLPPGAEQRQAGEVLPEYHAVLMNQAIASLRETSALTEAEIEEKMVELAKLIAPLPQGEAKALIEEVKAPGKSRRQSSSRRRRPLAKKPADGGFVTCSCCHQVLKLEHLGDGTHQVQDTPLTGKPQLPDPGLPQVKALPEAAPAGQQTALATVGTLAPILKMTSGYTIDSFPKGQETILTKQTTGFWGRPDPSPANPDFSEKERPPLLYTFDPWVGCLWGAS